jgi:hypothetical protein
MKIQNLIVKIYGSDYHEENDRSFYDFINACH